MSSELRTLAVALLLTACGRSDGFAGASEVLSTYFYVAAETSGTISVLKVESADGLLVEASSTASDGVVALAVSPDQGYLVASRAADSELETYQIDPATGALGLTSSRAGPANARALAFHPTLAVVYAASYDSSTITAYRLSSGALTSIDSETTGTQPVGIAVSPSGRFLYTANYGAAGGTNGVTGFAVSESDGSLTPLGAGFNTGILPVSIAVDPLGELVAVASSTAVNLFALDSSTGALSGRTDTATADPAASLAFSPDAASLFVARSAALGGLYGFAVDSSTRALTAGGSIPADGTSTFVAADPSGDFVVVVSAGGANSATLVSPGAGGAVTELSSLAVGGDPTWIAPARLSRPR